MEKKKYSAPKVKEVKMSVKNSVLGTCHSSTTFTPIDEPVEGLGCIVNNCFAPV